MFGSLEASGLCGHTVTPVTPPLPKKRAPPFLSVVVTDEGAGSSSLQPTLSDFFRLKDECSCTTAGRRGAGCGSVRTSDKPIAIAASFFVLGLAAQDVAGLIKPRSFVAEAAATLRSCGIKSDRITLDSMRQEDVDEDTNWDSLASDAAGDLAAARARPRQRPGRRGACLADPAQLARCRRDKRRGSRPNRSRSSRQQRGPVRHRLAAALPRRRFAERFHVGIDVESYSPSCLALHWYSASVRSGLAQLPQYIRRRLAVQQRVSCF
jgi:hypothetical protein